MQQYIEEEIIKQLRDPAHQRDAFAQVVNFDGDAAQMKLQKAILTLPEKQRAVFNMKYFDDMKYEDMSEIFGTSVGALKASYHHAVKKVEEFLTKDI